MNEPPSTTQETAVEGLFSACAASHLMSCLPSPSIVPAHVSLTQCEAFAD